MDPKLQAAANYINSRRYREAINTLDQVQQRSAMWYYLSGCANAGIGNQILARDHAAQAVNMEPNNMQFRQLLNQLDFNSRRYQTLRMVEAMHRKTISCGTGNMCCDLWLADTLCECMGAISAHACKSKTNGIWRFDPCGDCRVMALGSVIETNTLFLLAAAAFFVGIVICEFGLRTGAAFYLAAILLGFLVTPNKFYVITFAAMGFYILGIEAVWIFLAKRPQMGHRMGIYWLVKYVIFNLVYLPCLFGFRSMLFQKAVSDQLLLAAVMVGQIAILVYDKAYQYVQGTLWEKWRKRIL